MVLHCKMMLRELQGKVVDRDLAIARKERADMMHVHIETEEMAKDQAQKSKEAQDKVKGNGKELREKELLDFHHEELIRDNQKMIKKKNKILAGIRKNYNMIMHFITYHVTWAKDLGKV